MGDFIHTPIYLTSPRPPSCETPTSQAPLYVSGQYYPCTTYVALAQPCPSYPVAYLPSATTLCPAYPVPIPSHVMACPVVHGFYVPYAMGTYQPVPGPPGEGHEGVHSGKGAPAPAGTFQRKQKRQGGEADESHLFEPVRDKEGQNTNGNTEGGHEYVMSGALNGGKSSASPVDGPAKEDDDEEKAEGSSHP